MSPPEAHRHTDPGTLALLQHLLQHTGLASGLVDTRGHWLYMSEALRRRLELAPAGADGPNALSGTSYAVTPVQSGPPGHTRVAYQDLQPSPAPHTSHYSTHYRPSHRMMGFLTRKAIACIQTRQGDIHWLTPADTASQADLPLPTSTATVHRPQTTGLIKLTPLQEPADMLCLLTLHDALDEPDTLNDTIQTLRRQALTDPLTGLYNRRWVNEEALARIPLHAPEGQPRAAVLMLDLDYFKQVNDDHGHTVGDQVLQIVGARLSSLVRTEDCVCRYGGEEFLVLLPVTPLDAALRIAERMRQQVSQLMDCLPDRCMTISAGISTLREGEPDLDAAIERADEALYAAKAAGRDCARTDTLQD